MENNIQKESNKWPNKIKKGLYLISLTLIFAIVLAGAAAAEDPTNDTNDTNITSDTPHQTTNNVYYDTQGNPLPEDPADIAVNATFYNSSLNIIDALNNGFPTPITTAKDGDTVWKVVRCYNTGYPGANDLAYVHVLDYLDPAYYTINNYQMWSIVNGGWVNVLVYYNTTTGDWNVGAVDTPPKDFWNNYLFINVTLHGNATILTNNASVNSSTYAGFPVFDPDVFNNNASATLQLLEAHVDLNKFYADYDQFVNHNHNIVPITTSNYQGKVIVIQAAHNNGPGQVSFLNITDNWPSALLSTGEYWNQYTDGTWHDISPFYVSGTWNWTPTNSGPINSGETFLTAIGAIVNTSGTTITNTLTTNKQTPDDPVGFDTVSANLQVKNTAALELTKTVNNNKPKLHDTVIYTLIVQNHGPNTAITVKVSDVLPAGLEYVSSQANFGSYNPNTGIWTIGNLPANTVAKLIITSTIEQTGTLINNARVSSQSYDPELYPTTAQAIINVTNNNQNVSAATVPMQKTGAPLVPLAIGILLVFAGLVNNRRKH